MRYEKRYLFSRAATLISFSKENNMNLKKK